MPVQQTRNVCRAEPWIWETSSHHYFYMPLCWPGIIPTTGILAELDHHILGWCRTVLGCTCLWDLLSRSEGTLSPKGVSWQHSPLLPNGPQLQTDGHNFETPRTTGRDCSMLESTFGNLWQDLQCDNDVYGLHAFIRKGSVMFMLKLRFLWFY